MTEFKFESGDFYIFGNANGENVLWVRGDNGSWYSSFTKAGGAPIFDHDIERVLSMPEKNRSLVRGGKAIR
jgi:hypothetical protein